MKFYTFKKVPFIYRTVGIFRAISGLGFLIIYFDFDLMKGHPFLMALSWIVTFAVWFTCKQIHESYLIEAGIKKNYEEV